MKTWVIIGSLSALFVSAGFARELYNNYQVDREIANLQAKAKALETQKISISELKDELSSQDFLEGEARLKMGLKKPGETAIIIPESSEPVPVTVPTPLPSVSEEHTVRDWFAHFFE